MYSIVFLSYMFFSHPICLQRVLPRRFCLRPSCPCGCGHPCPPDGADLPALLWSGLGFCGPHFCPAGGNGDAGGLGTGHFLSAPAFRNPRRGGPAAARDGFDLAFERLDLFFYRNQFLQLFNRQVLEWCHNSAQGAPPPAWMSRNVAPESAGSKTSFVFVLQSTRLVHFREGFTTDSPARPAATKKQTF